jgi:hypothetical protein
LNAHSRSRGQAIAEFALVLPLLVFFLMGTIDLGRAIYTYNGVSQAAREIAREASLHPGSPLGSSAEVQAVIAQQKALVPGMDPPIFHCYTLTNTPVPGDGSGGCAAPDVVKVEVHSKYRPVALLGLGNMIDIASFSSNQIQ